MFDTSERESFQKLKIGNNVTLLGIARLRNSEIFAGALSKWKNNEVPCRVFPHIELLTVLIDSISFYFSTSFQYLKRLWTYHKEMRKDSFRFNFYLKIGSKVWRSTGKKLIMWVASNSWQNRFYQVKWNLGFPCSS